MSSILVRSGQPCEIWLLRLGRELRAANRIGQMHYSERSLASSPLRWSSGLQATINEDQAEERVITAVIWSVMYETLEQPGFSTRFYVSSIFRLHIL